MTSKRSSWQIQKAVYRALFMREVATRFGGYRLGYFWAIAEPASQILVLSLLFGAIGRDGFFGIPFPLFFGTGVLLFFIVSRIIDVSTNAIQTNRGLFGFRQVMPMDSVLVRAALEFIIVLATIVFLGFIGGWFFAYPTLPRDPLGFALILFLFFITALGIGLCVSILGALLPEIAKLVPILVRPLYFISGIIIPIGALPERFHGYLLWNPLLHGVELGRYFFFDHYPNADTSLVFFAVFSVASLFLGLLVFRSNRVRVLTT